MGISTTLEYWNEAPEPDDIHIITHGRKNFYNGYDIAWYEFSIDGTPLHELGHEDLVPKGFLRVPDTNLYEFGGSTIDAKLRLTNSGFTIIIKGNEL